MEIETQDIEQTDLDELVKSFGTESMDMSALYFDSRDECLRCITQIKDAMISRYGGKSTYHIELIIDECLANALYHGEGKARVFYSCGDSCFRIAVFDYGRGFDPGSVPDPTTAENIDKMHGRGIFLMRALADSIRWNERGNKVFVEKRVQ